MYLLHIDVPLPSPFLPLSLSKKEKKKITLSISPPRDQGTSPVGTNNAFGVTTVTSKVLRFLMCHCQPHISWAAEPQAIGPVLTLA